jgi:hypothetical protein
MAVTRVRLATTLCRGLGSNGSRLQGDRVPPVTVSTQGHSVRGRTRAPYLIGPSTPKRALGRRPARHSRRLLLVGVTHQRDQVGASPSGSRPDRADWAFAYTGGLAVGEPQSLGEHESGVPRI